jgi:hypothetical protein
MATTSTSCFCALGLTGPASCSPSAGAICCANQNYPGCTCEPGQTSCPSGSVQVSSCGVPTCGPGYTYPLTVSSCR